MKGDFTRQTFRGGNHYRSVLVQQGRVQLDADLNEQAQIQAHLDQLTGVDTIGASGAPEHDAGMAIVDADGRVPRDAPAAELMITEGRYYVDGILCENDRPIPLGAQPDLPGVGLPAADGTYVAALDVWLEHLTSLEQPDLLEVALGGVTTTTRARTVWQVKLRPAGTEATPASTGQLAAHAVAPPPDAAPPCAVASSVGYRGLENQLYRVEIHDPTGAPGGPTFVWSRENGSVTARLLHVDGNVLTVDSVGPDDRLSFAAKPYPWVEVIDLARQRRGDHGYLGRIGSIDGTTLTIAEWRGNAAPAEGDLGAGAVVRRWESADAQPVTSADWIPLEDGIEVRFADGTFATGDYWLIPARTADLEGMPAIQGLTGNVEWPVDGNGDPVLQAPAGVSHHFADIATLVRSEATWTLQADDRMLFPPLTELAGRVDVQYAGGDGQRAVPGNAVPRPLEVSVSRVGAPVSGAVVRFGGDGRLVADPGDLDGPPVPVLDAVTDADGVVRCWWRPAPDPQQPSQRVSARWVPPGADAAADPPIDFFAALDLAPPSVRIVAGQGQRGQPDAALTAPVQVEVRDAHGAVLPGATVVFRVASGSVAADEAGLALGPVETSVVTDGGGGAACRWQLGDDGPVQTLTASAAAPWSLPGATGADVTFVAAVVAGSPFAPGLHVTGVVLGGSATALTTDQLVAATALAGGVDVLLDGPPDPATVDGKPVITVTVDLPFPVSDPDRAFWGPQVSGTVPLTLAGTAAVTERAGSPAVTWTPTAEGTTFLNGLIAKVPAGRVLAHLTVSGRSVAAVGAWGVVNGLTLASPVTDPQLPSVDDVRGGDLQLRFWLVETHANLVIVPVKGSRLALRSTTDALALAVPRNRLRAALRPGIAATEGPGEDAARARRAVGRAFRNGADRQVTLVVDDRYAAAAEVITEAMAAAGVTVHVVPAADPAAVVTARRAAGDPVDGVLTDAAALDPITALPDFLEEVPV